MNDINNTENQFCFKMTNHDYYNEGRFDIIFSNGKKKKFGILEKYKKNKTYYSFTFYNLYGKNFHVKKVNLENYRSNIYIFIKNKDGSLKKIDNRSNYLQIFPLTEEDIKYVKIFVNALDGLYIFETNKTDRFYENENIITISKKGLKFITNTPKFNYYYDDSSGQRNEIDKQFNGSNFRQISNKPNNNQIVYFCFSNKESKSYYIINEYIKDADYHSILNSEFSDDTTINHIVGFKNNNITAINFMNHILELLPKPSIYNIPVYDIIKNSIHDIVYYNTLLTKNTKIDYAYEEICLNIFNKIKQKFNNSTIDTLNYLYSTYHCNESPYSYLKYENIKDYKKIRENRKIQFEEKYNEIFSKLVYNKEYNTKWKSELELYKLVKQVYDDAIYQYHNFKLLKYQSFDIYIPSKSIAIEYQGEQHYMAVEIFGGKEKLLKQQELDENKRKICLANNIKLIEWKYNEPITKIILDKKINDIL